MTVYHGGLTEVRLPKIRQGEYVGDFGVGFYVTSSLEQARRFVKTKGKRENVSKGFVSVYEVDEKLFTDDYRGMTFPGPTEEWAKFVSENRKRPSFSHDYDYVRGPVANDQVYATFAYYESGMISFEMLLDQLKVRKLFDQILFHTERALSRLRYVRSEEVTWER